MKRFKNKLIYILILLFLALTAVVVKMAMEYQRETEYRRENIKTTVVDDKYDEILYVETGAINPIDTVIVTKQNTRYAYTKLVFPGEYIYLADCEYTYDFKEGDILKIDKAQYEICDLTTGRTLRTIDVKEISEMLEPDQIIVHPAAGAAIMDQEGNKYISFNLKNKEDPEDKRRMYVNIETGEAFVRMRSDGIEEIKSLSGKQSSSGTSYNVLVFDEIGLIKANGFESYYSERYGEVTFGMDVGHWGYDIVQIDIPKAYLPERNETLYAEFPGLAEYEGSDDEILTFYISGSPTAEEILKMFMEEGEEISFEGCVLPANSSKDGQEHEIHSFEEYEQWCEYS